MFRGPRPPWWLVQGTVAAGPWLPGVFGLTASHRQGQPQAQSQVGSYLVLFHAPHQFLCLNPQVSAQREVSGEETSSISLCPGLEAGPSPPPRSPSPSPRLHGPSPGSGRQTGS